MRTYRSWNRREFLEFLGRGAALVAAGGVPGVGAAEGPGIPTIAPQRRDDVVLAEGFGYRVIARWNDVINSAGERFGFNCDYTAFLPQDRDRGLLWVNHEYSNPLFVGGETDNALKSEAQVIAEQESVGGSILELARGGTAGEWGVVAGSPFNRRVSARTRMAMISERPIQGETTATGTLANCAGGVTGWGSILTCEEDYYYFYGEAVYAADGTRSIEYTETSGWERYFNRPPEHYGWVVEVDVRTGEARKLTALGRFAHEGATFARTRDGRAVVYMGDDDIGQCIYKFVSDSDKDLVRGVLYVANTEKGYWIPLEVRSDPRLKEAFSDQTDLLIRTREAARLVDGSPQDRPEGIAIDPLTGSVVIALTNNRDRGNVHGSLLKIEEQDGDPGASRFNASTLMAGGDEAGFSCPDNLAFDANGNLWVTSDISSSRVGELPYAGFGNNGLFVIPASGPDRGRALQVASAPIEAEFTGPSFAPDGRTLFLSVQHPGELSEDLAKPTSRWPDGGDSPPRPSVIAITGPALERIAGTETA